MAKGTWTCQIKSGGSWTADGTISRPNDSLPLPKVSTQNKVVLADGSFAFVTPSIKYRDEPLIFTWYFDDGTVKTKIEGYINSQNDVKLIDHNSREYVGRFTNISPTWLVGFSTDKYNIRASFEVMPLIA
ncbi:hypothetical protein LCGC14_1161050 [marine sediment metagenome]|uniref:Uncharacterized protein n=1 Tax=marine sediment metagenome TaxID=412755 RepID=A0A0F9MFK9_9ZZZZ